MRHSNSFTHEPLWVVTHTAWPVIVLPMAFNTYLTLAILMLLKLLSAVKEPLIFQGWNNIKSSLEQYVVLDK